MKKAILIGTLTIGAVVTAFVLGRTSGWTSSPRSAATRQPGFSPRPEAPEREATRQPARREEPDGARKHGARSAAPVRKIEKPKGPPPRAGYVTGRVHMEDAQSPEGATVFLKSIPSEEGEEPFEREAALDPSGEISFDGLSPGRYSIEATHPDYAPHKFDLELKEGEGAGPFFFSLKKGGALLIRVNGGVGEPLRDEAIRVRDDSNKTVAEGFTDESGEFLVERLSPGSYRVTRIVQGATGDGPTRTAAIVPGETAEVVFEVSCGLTGTVLGPDGNSLAGGLVRLTPVTFGKEGYRNVKARVSLDGSYEMRGFAPGEYTLSVQVFGKTAYTVDVGKVTLGPGQVLDRPIRIESSSLSGRVTREDTGEPLSSRGVQIGAWRVNVRDGNVIERLGKMVMAFADKDGHYSFVGLQPGSYQIWIAPHIPELRDVKRVVDFAAGGNRKGVDFALSTRTLGTLRLRVLEPDGSPATGVTFSRATRNGSTSLHGKQVGDGIHEFPMEVGPRVVRVYRKGFIADDVVVTISARQTVEHEVQLRRVEER